MERMKEDLRLKLIGRCIGVGVVIMAILLLLIVISQIERHPRTDDALIWAKPINIAPEVSGHLVERPLKDNSFVKKGALLFAIDPRPYQYALTLAISNQATLELQIIDEERRNTAEHSPVAGARYDGADSTTEAIDVSNIVDGAKASIGRAQAALDANGAQLRYLAANLNRIEPLLSKQYVTAEQVDEARISVRVAEANYDEANATLARAQAKSAREILRQQRTDGLPPESKTTSRQVIHPLDTLISERPAMAAQVDLARLDLEHCRMIAPLDSYVTNVNLSEGAYVRSGIPIFTLIDTRVWWVIANYRESKLKNIHRGSLVDVYLIARPDRRFHGIVENVGDKIPSEDVLPTAAPAFVRRLLSGALLSSNVPIRIRIQDPDPELFRIGNLAVTVVR